MLLYFMQQIFNIMLDLPAVHSLSSFLTFVITQIFPLWDE